MSRMILFETFVAQKLLMSYVKLILSLPNHNIYYWRLLGQYQTHVLKTSGCIIFNMVNWYFTFLTPF